MKNVSREPGDEVVLVDVVNVRTEPVTLLTGDVAMAANRGIHRPVTAKTVQFLFYHIYPIYRPAIENKQDLLFYILMT